MLLKTVASLIFFFFSLPVSAGNLLQDVRQAINRIKPFRVNFVQQVIIDGELEIEESGEILFQDISRLKWTYLDPEFKVFIMDGNSFRFYDRENKQLIKGEVTKKNQKWIWQLLFSDEDAANIRLDEKKRVIHFHDDQEDMDFEIFIGENLLPERAFQQDTTGVKYRYFFRHYKNRVAISGKDFELDLPVDVEIIDGNLD
jgi:outer membrane lipoprotein-sorting protein